MPAVLVFTAPVVTILEVKLPSILSLAVAPCSEYVSPTFKLSVDEPISVITGATVSAITFTVLVTCVAAFPAASLTL